MLRGFEFEVCHGTKICERLEAETPQKIEIPPILTVQAFFTLTNACETSLAGTGKVILRLLCLFYDEKGDLRLVCAVSVVCRVVC